MGDLAHIERVEKMLPHQRVMQFFEYEHLPPHLREVSAACKRLADQMCEDVPHNAEHTVGLRKLLEAKDCFVRAVLFQGE